MMGTIRKINIWFLFHVVFLSHQTVIKVKLHEAEVTRIQKQNALRDVFTLDFECFKRAEFLSFFKRH